MSKISENHENGTLCANPIMNDRLVQVKTVPRDNVQGKTTVSRKKNPGKIRKSF
jgi:hypothetical protein